MLRVLLFHTDIQGGDEIRKALSSCACDAELTHVRNVAGFLAAMEQWCFDAILLDYAPLPSESSAVLAAAKQWWSVTPTIALCAPAAENDGRMALREGVADYVLGEQWMCLASTIRRAVTNAQSRAQSAAH